MPLKLLQQTTQEKQKESDVAVIKRIDPYRKMSLKEKKKIKSLVRRAKFQRKIADSAQRTMPGRRKNLYQNLGVWGC